MKSNHLLGLVLVFLGAEPALGQGMLMLDNPARAAVGTDTFFFDGAAFLANDMLPLSHFEDDPWPANYRTRAGANLGIANEMLSFGARRGDWSVGYFYRQDWLLKANRDSVDAYYLDRTGQLTSQLRNFNLDYTAIGFVADGLHLALSRSFPTAQGNELRWGVGASLLRGRSVRKEQVNGSLISTVGSATANGSRELFDSSLRAVTSPSSFNDFSPGAAQDVSVGLGYAFDLGLSWNLENGAHLGLAVNDLFGQIKWDRMPLIEQNVNGTLVGSTFSSGATPIISGSNRYQSLSLDLNPKLLIEGMVPIGNLALTGRLESVDGLWFPQVGAAYAFNFNLRIGLEYESRFGAMQISLRHPKYYVSLSSESLHLDESRALGVSAGLNFEF